MSTSTTQPADLAEHVRELVLSQLPSLRLDRGKLEAALDAGQEARIPSRKAMVLIARVCHALGVSGAVKKSDLRPDQVTGLENLITLLQTRLAAVLVKP